MDEHYENDYEGDGEDLPPALAAQLAQLEHKHQLREREQGRRRHRTLKIRRQLEDWKDHRRIRDEIDYLV